MIHSVCVMWPVLHKLIKDSILISRGIKRLKIAAQTKTHGAK